MFPRHNNYSIDVIICKYSNTSYKILNIAFLSQTNLQPQLDDIVSRLLSEVDSVSSMLTTTLTSSPGPLLPHTPPVATKLLWLNALKERVMAPMNKVKEIAPYLLEGDQGWKLRQVYAQVTTKIDE